MGQVTRLPAPAVNDIAKQFVPCRCGSTGVRVSFNPEDLRRFDPEASCRDCGTTLRRRISRHTRNVVPMEFTRAACQECGSGAFTLLATGRVMCHECDTVIDGLVVLFPMDDPPHA